MPSLMEDGRNLIFEVLQSLPALSNQKKKKGGLNHKISLVYICKPSSHLGWFRQSIPHPDEKTNPRPTPGKPIMDVVHQSG